MAKILLVDDDKNNLNAMWRVFWLDGQHEAERFATPSEALARAKEAAFDCVISDYRMAEMDGVRFLQAFRELQPHAYRVLISGAADMALFRQTMKDSKFQYLLEKPCEGFQLMRVVQEGLEQSALAAENRRLKEELAVLQAKYDQLLAHAH